MPFDWSNRSSVERLFIHYMYASVYTFTFTLNCHLGKTHKGNNAEDTVQSSHFYINTGTTLSEASSETALCHAYHRVPPRRVTTRESLPPGVRLNKYIM
jgi:hypothetical protein